MKVIFIVIVVIAAVWAAVSFTGGTDPQDGVSGQMAGALDSTAMLDLNTKFANLQRALIAYYAANDQYPESLEQLLPEYIRTRDQLTDPWGEPIIIETNGDDTMDDDTQATLISPGKDRVLGNDDDIIRRIR